MVETSEHETEPPAPVLKVWGVVLSIGVCVVLYFCLRRVVPGPHVPWAAVPVLLILGAASGFLIARQRKRMSRASEKTSGTGLGTWTTLGLAGIGIGLSQVLPPNFFELLILGFGGLLAGVITYSREVNRLDS